MTLNFKKLLKNLIIKQMSIQHVEIPEDNVQIFKREELAACSKVTQRMKNIYGENFNLDADYFIFFSKLGTDISFTKEFINKTLFKVINAAAGNSANDMRENEIRVFSFDGNSEPIKTPDATIDDVNLTGGNENADAVSNVLNNTSKSTEKLSHKEELDESVENPQNGEKFAFVKITMK